MRIFGLGPMELAIILGIVLLLFGPTQVPKLAKMFGKAARDLRDGFDASGEDDAKAKEIPEAKSEAAAPAAKKEDAEV